MPTKYIRLPSDIELKNPETDEPLLEEGRPAKVSFVDFLRRAVLRDPRWNYTADALEAKAQILDKAKVAASGDGVMEIAEKPDLELLQAVVASPQHTGPNGQPRQGYATYHPDLHEQFLPFVRAIRGAALERPESR